MLLAALPLGGCALSAPPARNGRYSVDITELHKSVRYQNTWVYRSPTRRVADFQRFLIRPVVVYPDPVHRIKNRAPFDALQEKLTQRVMRMIGRDHVVVDTPSEGTLEMRIAVVDLKPVVEMKDAQNNDLIRTNTATRGSKIEIDCHDSITNEQIFAMSTIYQGKEFAAYLKPALIPNVEKAFDEWSVYFKARFDEALRAPPPAPTPGR